MFASISSCACTDKKQKQQQQKMVHRQIWPFGSGSNFVKFPIYRLVIASLQRSLGILFLNFLCQHERTNVLTNIQVSRCNVWDRVRYLHSKFQTNLHTFADKYERMTNTRLWWICHTSRIRIHTCEESWQIRIFHTCDRFVRLSGSSESVTRRRCEELARILHTCEEFHVWSIHMCDKYFRIFHTSKIRYLWRICTD